MLDQLFRKNFTDFQTEKHKYYLYKFSKKQNETKNTILTNQHNTEDINYSNRSINLM